VCKGLARGDQISEVSEVEDAINFLHKQGIAKINTLVRATDGGNFGTYIIGDSRNQVKFVLKIFPANRLETRLRWLREVNFLRWAESIDCPAFSPRLIALSHTRGWIIMSHLEGQKVKDLSPELILRAAEIFRKIFEHSSGRKKLPILAKDAFLNRVRIQREMHRRRESLEKCLKEKNLRCECPIQLSETFHFYTPDKVEQDINVSIEFRNQVHNWLGFSLVMTPSDVGFHNCLLDARTGDLSLFDFEYSGLDSPLKTMLDFIFQPELHLNSHLADVFFSSFVPQSAPRFSELPISLLRLFAFKWEMITASRCLKNTTHICFAEAISPLVRSFRPMGNAEWV
jgi:hypothetical protein